MKNTWKKLLVVLLCCLMVSESALASSSAGTSDSDSDVVVITEDLTEDTTSEEGIADTTETSESESEEIADASGDETAESEEETTASGESSVAEETLPSETEEGTAVELEEASEEETEEADETGESSSEEETEEEEEISLTLKYSLHIQKIGDTDWVDAGTFCGTQGQSLRAEGITISAEATGMEEGGIEYRTHIQSIGWTSYSENGEYSGTTGQALRMEAIQIRLTGDWAENYDIYYRVYCQTYGWLDWAKNDEVAGTIGYSKRVEGIEIVLVEKGGEAPGDTTTTFKQKVSVYYTTHVQKIGWQSAVSNGSTSGTTGKSYRVEAIKIETSDSLYSGGISYSAHVQSVGWQDWVSDGSIAGTTNQSLRMEAIKIKLTGELAEQYDVYYRVHVQTLGWMDWACNGEAAGTSNFRKRIEAIQIVLVEKGGSAPGSTSCSYVDASDIYVTYQSHVQTSGTLSWVTDGATSGTTGKSLRLEGLRIKVNSEGLSGSISYKAYGSNGWTSGSDGTLAGTTGKSIAVEAISISLSGELAQMYDVYYRVYLQTYGWLGWAKNGQTAGSTETGKRIEAYQVILVRKEYGTTLSNSGYFKEAVKNGWYYENGYKLYYSNGTLVTDVESIIGTQSTYQIKVNKTMNVVTIYAKDGSNGYIIPVKSFICSTGSATPVGTYSTLAKYRWHELMGPCWGQWCTRIVDGVLFHSVYYNSYNDNFTLSVKAYNKLGTTCSHGCVRLTAADAKWIYDNCSLGTTVIVYESSDPGPFGKPTAYTLSSSHTWDPTDPTAYYKCQELGCH